jgi:hypothetical protein
MALRENSTLSGGLPPLPTPCVLLFWGKVQGSIPSCAPSPKPSFQTFRHGTRDVRVFPSPGAENITI